MRERERERERRVREEREKERGGGREGEKEMRVEWEEARKSAEEECRKRLADVERVRTHLSVRVHPYLVFPRFECMYVAV